MAYELIILRLLHVGLGAFWVGAVLFNTFYVGPALRTAGPAAAGAVMGSMISRKLMVVMPTVAVLTMLSGLRLMMIVAAGNPHWFQHRSGHTYSVAAAAAIIAFIIGLTVVRPTMTRAGNLGREAASDAAARERLAPEIARLQARAGRANMAVAWLLIIAVAGMAIARYL